MVIFAWAVALFGVSTVIVVLVIGGLAGSGALGPRAYRQVAGSLFDLDRQIRPR
ncbi:MAG: hypothetical protein ACK5RL_20980 [Acidimicrobiales bacterium]